jgi:hypothetical protein
MFLPPAGKAQDIGYDIGHNDLLDLIMIRRLIEKWNQNLENSLFFFCRASPKHTLAFRLYRVWIFNARPGRYTD